MLPDKLAYMANQIGKFFAHQPHDRAVLSITEHLVKFWDPRMRGTILTHFDEVKDGLDPLVRQAVEKLRDSRLS